LPTLIKKKWQHAVFLHSWAVSSAACFIHVERQRSCHACSTYAVLLTLGIFGVYLGLASQGVCDTPQPQSIEVQQALPSTECAVASRVMTATIFLSRAFLKLIAGQLSEAKGNHCFSSLDWLARLGSGSPLAFAS